MNKNKLHELTFDFVKNLAWLCQNYNQELCETTATSLDELILAVKNIRQPGDGENNG